MTLKTFEIGSQWLAQEQASEAADARVRMTLLAVAIVLSPLLLLYWG
jgi:hypothetical protein